MRKTLSAVEARKKFGEVLEGVYYRGDEVIIERAGKPMAVVVPMARYEAHLRNWDRIFELIELSQERNKGVPLEVIEADIKKAIQEVRSEQRTAQPA